MEIHTDTPDKHVIKAYTDTSIQIDDIIYEQSLLITPNEIIYPWPIKDITQLTTQECQHLLSYQPEMILLGTGIQTQFLPPKMLAEFGQVGVEVMTTPAACRTYHILAAEQRRLVAGFIL